MQKKDYTAVDRVIILSKTILALKILKLHIKRGYELAKEIGINLYEMEHVNSQINEINRRILEFNSQVKFLLYPLFKGKNFGYNEIEHWCLTTEDLQKGYLALEEINKNGNYMGDDHKFVIPLSNYTDKKFKLQQGTLLPFKDVVSILGNQKNKYGNLPKVNSYLKSLHESLPVKKLNLRKNDNNEQEQSTDATEDGGYSI